MASTSSEPRSRRRRWTLGELAAIVRNTCRTPGAGPDAPSFDLVTTPSAHQQHALDLIEQIRL